MNVSLIYAGMDVHKATIQAIQDVCNPSVVGLQ